MRARAREEEVGPPDAGESPDRAPAVGHLFCRFASGQAEVSIVHEDERTVTFMDIEPIVLSPSPEPLDASAPRRATYRLKIISRETAGLEEERKLRQSDERGLDRLSSRP